MFSISEAGVVSRKDTGSGCFQSTDWEHDVSSQGIWVSILGLQEPHGDGLKKERMGPGPPRDTHLCPKSSSFNLCGRFALFQRWNP